MKQVLDFIVIGAQKCGTTSLFEYLARHPGLSLPPGKEAPYFVNENKYGGDWGDYLQRALPSSDPSRRWGTVTPQYMYGGAGNEETADVRTVPRRIRKRLPDVRLIAILRDPVQRARSHHAMAVIDGWETRSFDQAVQELLEPGVLNRSRRELSEVTGYVVFGEYGRILAGYYEVFSPEQIMVLFTNELQADPQSVVRRVFEFLDVEMGFVPDNLGTHYHESGTAPRLKWLDLYRFQVAAASHPALRGAWHALPETARRRIDAGYIRMNYRARIWNRRGWSRRGASRNGEQDATTDQLLSEHFKSDAERLTDLIGVAPPWARALTSGPAGI